MTYSILFQAFSLRGQVNKVRQISRQKALSWWMEYAEACYEIIQSGVDVPVWMMQLAGLWKGK